MQDYPKHASRCPPPEVDAVCNIDLPSHPKSKYTPYRLYAHYTYTHTHYLFIILLFYYYSIKQNKVLCNFVRHPNYPKYCHPRLAPGTNTVCNAPAHPTGELSVYIRSIASIGYTSRSAAVVLNQQCVSVLLQFSQHLLTSTVDDNSNNILIIIIIIMHNL